MSGGDSFAAGKWQVEGWLESGQGSTRGTPAAGSPDMVTLAPAQAAAPPAAVFFSQFYHGEQEWPDVSFSKGKVSGSLHHGRTDVPVSGSYARDHFQITLRYGGSVDQVIEGKLVEPAS
jgi:hypothetical protein